MKISAPELVSASPMDLGRPVLWRWGRPPAKASGRGRRACTAIDSKPEFLAAFSPATSMPSAGNVKFHIYTHDHTGAVVGNSVKTAAAFGSIP